MSDFMIDDEVKQLSEAETVPPDSALIGERSSRSKPLGQPDWLPSAKKRLTSILSLSENWDSYGAAAPDAEIVNSAYAFLLFVASEVSTIEPYIAPTATGGVFVEWTTGDHELEVDLISHRAATYVYENTDTEQTLQGELFNDDADDGTFLRLLRDFFSCEPRTKRE